MEKCEFGRSTVLAAVLMAAFARTATSDMVSVKGSPTGDTGLENLLILSSIFGGNLNGGAFGGFGGMGIPGLAGSLGAGLGSLGTGGALTTLPIVGDFRQFNQVLSGKCIIVGSGCKASNSVCTAVIDSVQNVGTCKCKSGYLEMEGACYANMFSGGGDATPGDIVVRTR